MATNSEQQILLLYLKKRQRNRVRLVQTLQLMLLADKKRRHRFWVHDILQKRKEHGIYHHVVRELESDRDKYHEYFRMSAAQLIRLSLQPLSSFLWR